MTRILSMAGAAASVLAATMTIAQAQEFSANLGVTNNYVWRGITQSDDDFAVQGGADVAFDNGLSAGIWASNVDWGVGDIEVDIYGNYAIPLADMVTGNIGVIGYLYPDQPSGAEANFVEFNAGVDFALDPITLSGDIYFSPDVAGDTTWYFSGGASVPVGEMFGLYGSVGYYEWETGTDTFDYAIGASVSIQMFTLSAGYHGTDLAGDDGNFVALLKVTFP
jgi:uncharacterized protein (TIGR02001 family)